MPPGKAVNWNSGSSGFLPPRETVSKLQSPILKWFRLRHLPLLNTERLSNCLRSFQVLHHWTQVKKSQGRNKINSSHSYLLSVLKKPTTHPQKPKPSSSSWFTDRKPSLLKRVYFHVYSHQSPLWTHSGFTLFFYRLIFKSACDLLVYTCLTFLSGFHSWDSCLFWVLILKYSLSFLLLIFNYLSCF